MNLENKIFYEIKQQKISANGLWRFQQYWGAFAINKLNANERKEFYNIMNNLCEQKIFTSEPYRSNTINYRLTEYGEHIIYD